jgi:PAS domain S-box-containing protein
MTGLAIDLGTALDGLAAVVWTAMPDGQVDFANRSWSEYTGLGLEASRGYPLGDAVNVADRPAFLDSWTRIRASGKSGEISARLRRFDGEYRWFNIQISPIRDTQGQIVRWCGLCNDIDDRKRMEEELRRSEAFLAAGQDLARMGHFSWRLDTDEIAWSERLYRIFEFEPGTTVTLDRIATRIHPEDLPRLPQFAGQIRRGDSDVEYQHRILMPDQSVKHLQLIAHRATDRSGGNEYIGTVLDITQRKRSDEALGRARAELSHVARVMGMGALTASIAHEVNQPLSGIVTNASTCLRMLAAEPPDIDGARETARRTIRDGNRAADVIARLRALFSKRSVTIERVDLADSAQEVIDLMQSELDQARVVLRTEFSRAVPLVCCDRVQVQQVIMNLLRNAADAMSHVHDRPRHMSVKTECESDARVSLSVRDTGVGFDPQDAERLFDTFYTTRHDGMGIGLAVSRSIIERHHGQLRATLPDEGPGAIFAFSIPICSS